MTFKVQQVHEVIGHSDALLIGLVNEESMDQQASSVGGASDQGQQGIESAQGNACPIDANGAKQAMLDRIPFGSASWIMANGDLQAKGIGKLCLLVLSLDAAPRAVTLTSPANNATVFVASPTYKWQPTDVANASYTLEVRNASNQVVQTASLAASACSATECSVTPTPTLAAGGYTWKVITTTTQGTTSSPSWALTINLGAPTLLWPTTSTTVPETGITLTWQALTGATQYVVNVKNAANADVVNQTVSNAQCSSGTCSYTVTLSNGNYTWRVQGKDSMGNASPWSTVNSFTVQVSTSSAYNWRYTYDALSRVTSACSDWNAATSTCKPGARQFTYTYDGAGNLTRLDKFNLTSSQVETIKFIYNGANQIKCVDLDNSGTCNSSEFLYQYDAYGNLLFDGATKYTYDAAMRLLTTCASSNGTSCSGTQTTYQYNGDGDRVAQTVETTTTRYIIDIATPLTMVLAETTGTKTTRYLHGLGVVAQNDGTNTRYFLNDGLGSVRQLTSNTGSVVLAQSFDPYGNPYRLTGPQGATTYGYTGEQTDSNGFVFLRARYYNPSQGRFMQADPSRQEMNPYQYGFSNPVKYTDPTGLCVQQFCFVFFFGGLGNTKAPVGDGGREDQFEAELERVAGVTVWQVFPYGPFQGYGPGQDLFGAGQPSNVTPWLETAYPMPSYGCIENDLGVIKSNWIWKTIKEVVIQNRSGINWFNAYWEIPKLDSQMEIDLIGYSGGGQIAYAAAQELQSYGLKVDNLVLVGSPLRASRGWGNIVNMYDITGDQDTDLAAIRTNPLVPQMRKVLADYGFELPKFALELLLRSMGETNPYGTWEDYNINQGLTEQSWSGYHKVTAVGYRHDNILTDIVDGKNLVDFLVNNSAGPRIGQK